MRREISCLVSKFEKWKKFKSLTRLVSDISRLELKNPTKKFLIKILFAICTHLKKVCEIWSPKYKMAILRNIMYNSVRKVRGKLILTLLSMRKNELSAWSDGKKFICTTERVLNRFCTLLFKLIVVITV